MIGIYKITFDSGEFYIGQTTNYEKRKAAHIQTKGLGSPRLHRAFIIHPTPKFELLEECSTQELNEREAFYIRELKPTLNTLPGGDAMQGLNHPRSKYTKEQLEQVLELYLFSNEPYKQIEKITGVANGTIHDVLKRRSHLWLTDGIPEHLFKDAYDRRSVTLLYDNNGTEYKVYNQREFEKQHNLPDGMIGSLATISKPFNYLGWSLKPIRRVQITTPENETFECTEFEAHNFLHDLPTNSKNMLFKKQRPSKGYSLKYLN